MQIIFKGIEHKLVSESYLRIEGRLFLLLSLFSFLAMKY